MLREFDGIIPGGADRILNMAEAEQAHRHACDTHSLQTERAAIRWGQALGSAVSITSILGATCSVYLHADWKATAALVGVPILGAIRAIIGSRAQP